MIELTLPKEANEKFFEAKALNEDAIDYFVIYFMSNVERQLLNLNLPPDVYALKKANCLRVIVMNLRISYDISTFFALTMRDIKNIIYLNQIVTELKSGEILEAQAESLKARFIADNAFFDSLPLSAVNKELGRLYFFNNVSVEELVVRFKCSKTLIYFRLREIADAYFKEKCQVECNYEEPFFTAKNF